MRKLLAIKANLRFWVCFGPNSPEPLVGEVDPTRMIRAIYLSTSLPKQGAQTVSAISQSGSISSKSPKNLQDSHADGFAGIRAKYPKAYERWTLEEDDLLQKDFREGVNVSGLSKRFQRTPGAIRSRLRKLGVR